MTDHVLPLKRETICTVFLQLTFGISKQLRTDPLVAVWLVNPYHIDIAFISAADTREDRGNGLSADIEIMNDLFIATPSIGRSYMFMSITQRIPARSCLTVPS